MWRLNKMNKNYFYKGGVYNKLLVKYKIKMLIKQIKLWELYLRLNFPLNKLL